MRQGDFLVQLANNFGFDPDIVWQDPSNATLRALRSNPNILCAGDVLYIPDLPTQPPPMTSLMLGATNSFVAQDPPTVILTHKFIGSDSTSYASKGYTVQELDQLTGLTTDGDGVATFEAPVTLATATIVFTDTGESWALHLGAMDPINTMSGIFMRLQNLGYIAGNVTYDGLSATNNLGPMRAGLQALKAAQAGDGEADSPSNSVPPSTPPPPSGAPASNPASAHASDSDPGSDPAADSDPGSDPPSSGAASAPPSSPGTYDLCGGGWQQCSSSAADTSGLADDGTLDPDTEKLLLSAYGV